MTLQIAAVEQLVRPMRSAGWRGWIDVPEPGPIPENGLTAIRGWVAAEPTRGAAGPGDIEIRRTDGSILVAVPRDAHRPDVAAAIPGVTDRAGYAMTVDLRGVGQLVTVTADGVELGRLHLTDDAGPSQRGEDTVIAALLPDTAPRWLIDVGAHDGEHLSNSARFMDAGWHGVLIEPAPVPFAALRNRYLGREAKARCVQAACGDREGAAPLFLGADDEGGTNATLSTDDNEWFAATRSDRSIEVQVTTLARLCADHGVPTSFGLLLVDAEGMDLEVLQGLDPSPWRPIVLCTERYLHRPDKESAKAELLTRWGLVHHATVGWNDIWVRPDLG